MCIYMLYTCMLYVQTCDKYIHVSPHICICVYVNMYVYMHVSTHLYISSMFVDVLSFYCVRDCMHIVGPSLEHQHLVCPVEQPLAIQRTATHCSTPQQK